jgi:hypothetical protein
MLNKRAFRILIINREKPVSLNFDNNNGKEVKYSGKAMTIKL